jgi:hypothetical protein
MSSGARDEKLALALDRLICLASFVPGRTRLQRLKDVTFE